MAHAPRAPGSDTPGPTPFWGMDPPITPLYSGGQLLSFQKQGPAGQGIQKPPSLQEQSPNDVLLARTFQPPFGRFFFALPVASGSAQAASSACSTRSGVMSFRQRKCPSGQVRAKHGAQSSAGW